MSKIDKSKYLEGLNPLKRYSCCKKCGGFLKRLRYCDHCGPQRLRTAYMSRQFGPRAVQIAQRSHDEIA